MGNKAHQGDSKTFEQLSFDEQSKSINAQIVNLKKAIEANIRLAGQKGKDENGVRKKRIQQLLRMCERLIENLGIGQADEKH
ncbi:MAG: hypothetical protein WCX65_05855 [bacterium]